MSYIPTRMCCVCRTRSEKPDLYRFVCDANGHLLFDKDSKYQSRGVYLCRDVKCLKKAVEKKLLSRALHTAFSPEDYQRIEVLFNG